MGLVDDYGSDSDEDTGSVKAQSPVPEVAEATETRGSPSPTKKLEDQVPSAARPPSETLRNITDVEPTPPSGPALGPAPGPSLPAESEIFYGPSLGPSLPPPEFDSPAPDFEAASSDPYTATRSLIHSLILPPSIPSIPPSPPGSPSRELSQKFSHFRNLKSQGIHFNTKLLRSSTLNNPNLLQKLSAYVGITDEDLYTTNVKKEIWYPKGFGDDVRGGGLDQLQEKGRARREEERLKGEREKVEFISGIVDREQPARKEKASKWDEKSAGVRNNARDLTNRRENDRQRGDGRRRDARDGRDSRNRQDDDIDRDRKRRRSRSRSRERERDRYRDYEYRREC